MGSELGNSDGHYSGGEGDLSDKKKFAGVRTAQEEGTAKALR